MASFVATCENKYSPPISLGGRKQLSRHHVALILFRTLSERNAE